MNKMIMELCNDESKRVTSDEIIEMNCLYAKLGSYAAVGREKGRSGSTVARHVYY